jgi:hypothetical protein
MCDLLCFELDKNERKKEKKRNHGSLISSSILLPNAEHFLPDVNK